jgi:glycine oxidase
VKIGVVGAGLLGRLLTLKALEQGHQVTLFDPASDLQTPHSLEKSGAAAWTAAGMLSPLAELECANLEVMNWGLTSLQLWPLILARLKTRACEESSKLLMGCFQRRGSLLLAHATDRSSVQSLLGHMARQAAHLPAPRLLTSAELAQLEPHLHSTQSGLHAWLLEGEAHIDTVQVMRALGHDLVCQGVVFRGDRFVEIEKNSIYTTSTSTLALALALASLSNLPVDERFDHVFDVRGCGLPGQTTGMVGVRGVRGEIFWLHAPGVPVNRPLRLLHPRHRVYLVPRPGDILVVGASEIESEDRSPVSVRTTLELLSAAYSILPGLAEARIVHQETNLRPALPDNLPRIETQPGLSRINGLFRHGWLIAPALVEEAWQRAGLE